MKVLFRSFSASVLLIGLLCPGSLIQIKVFPMWLSQKHKWTVQNTKCTGAVQDIPPWGWCNRPQPSYVSRTFLDPWCVLLVVFRHARRCFGYLGDLPQDVTVLMRHLLCVGATRSFASENIKVLPDQCPFRAEVSETGSWCSSRSDQGQ